MIFFRRGTGFFAVINIHGEVHHVIVTNNHVINNKDDAASAKTNPANTTDNNTNLPQAASSSAEKAEFSPKARSNVYSNVYDTSAGAKSGEKTDLYGNSTQKASGTDASASSTTPKPENFENADSQKFSKACLNFFRRNRR